MPGSVDVVIAGRLYSDLIFTGVSAPAPGAEVYANGVAISPGGVANHAVAAARLGASTALLAEIGDDPISAVVAHMLHAEPNLDLSHCVHRGGAQGSISTAITDGFDRAFVSFEMPGDAPAWHGAAPRTAYVGVDAELPSWVPAAREAGTVVFGGAGWDPTGAWSGDMLDLLRHFDAIILNEGEALAYAREGTVDAALDVLAERIELAIVTQGAGGATAAQGDTRIHVPAIPVLAVDATGAGDAFIGAFMAATAWAWPLEDRLRLASAAAACVVGGVGGARSAPHPDEIGTLLAPHGLNESWDAIARWARGRASSPPHTPAPHDRSGM